MWNLVAIDYYSFRGEVVWNCGRTDGHTADDGRTTEPAYTISSPGAFGSGELKIYNKWRFILILNNLNNSNDVIWVFAYFQLIKIEIPYNFLILWDFSLLFSTFFKITLYQLVPVISMHVEKQCSSPLRADDPHKEGSENGTDRVASPESIPIQLQTYTKSIANENGQSHISNLSS